MNTEAYILSGILESYVLGITSPEETAEVESYALQYPEIAAEIQQIQAALENFAIAEETTPPAHLRNTILDTISELSAGNSKENRLGFEKNTIQYENNITDTKTVPLVTEKDNTQTVWFRPWMAAASIVLLLASLTGNLLLFNSLQHTKERLSLLENDKMQLSTVLQTSQKQVDELRNETAIFKDMKTIMLKGLKIAPDAKVFVCWRTDSKQVYVVSPQLPPPPTNMQYQLWAIVKGKPVDAGMLSKDGNVMLLKTIQEADAFAITLEKKGGNATPEGEMYVLGNV